MTISNLNVSAAAQSAAKPQLDSLKKATDSIEAMFLKNLFTEMQKSMGTSMFGKTPGSDIYQDMMNQELTKEIAKGGRFGVSKMLFNQLSPSVLAQAEAQVRLGKSGTGGKVDSVNPDSR